MCVRDYLELTAPLPPPFLGMIPSMLASATFNPDGSICDFDFTESPDRQGAVVHKFDDNTMLRTDLVPGQLPPIHKVYPSSCAPDDACALTSGGCMTTWRYVNPHGITLFAEAAILFIPDVMYALLRERLQSA